MGWWQQDAEGHSFADDADTIGLWGDQSADILDDAMEEIMVAFKDQLRRTPTKDEIRKGLEFSLRRLPLPESGYDPDHVQLQLGQPT